MKENWKWIKDYEGLYKISNYGKVKSYCKNKSGELIKLNNKNGWYLSFRAKNIHGRFITLRIHVEVAKAFIGEIPKGYHVHHKDGNKQNNCVSNLEIIHPSKHHIETIKRNKHVLDGMNNYNKYIKPKHIRQYTEDGIFLAEYANGEIASRMTGICQRNILQVANCTPFNKNGNARKQAGGYVWRFSDDESEVM